MKSIIIKELRENLKWAALGILLLAVGFGWVVEVNYRGTFASELIAGVTVGGFAIIAMAMGILQVVQDHLRHRWDFVVHRPISRAQLFVGKMVAGLLLYAVACLVPLLLAIGWYAFSGRVPAPFEWHMALPPLADIVGGVPWYFTGMLIAARRARWFGSRIMPAGLPLLLTAAAVIFADNFGEALLGAIIITLFMAPAAFASFVSNGDFERQPNYAKVLQSLAITTGIALAIALAGNIVGETLGVIIRRPNNSTWARYVIQEDGRVLVVRGNAQGESVTDLNGNAVSGIDSRNVSQKMLREVYLQLYRPVNSIARRGDSGFHHERHYVNALSSSGRSTWFYVVYPRTIEGFLSSGQHIGGIGRNGFVPPPGKPSSFSQPMKVYANSIVGDESTLYFVDTVALTMTRIFTAPADDPIVSAVLVDSLYGFSDAPASQQRVIIMTRTSLHFLTGDRQIFVVKLPPLNPSDFMQMSVGRVTDGSYRVMYATWLPQTTGYEQKLMVISQAGQILSEQTLPELKFTPFMVPWWQTLPPMLGAPPAFMWVMVILGKATGENIRTGEFWETICGFSVAGIVCALIAGAIVRRYRLDRRTRIPWIIYAFVGGLPGLLTMLSVRQWPARVACPACHKPRNVAHDRCDECSALFPPPANLGIEIFE